MRRVHVSQVSPGELPLEPAQAHHLRDVLRLDVGDEVEAFDDAGWTAVARVALTAGGVVLHAETVREPQAPLLDWTIASAVPKGNRADWMIEKLSELGTPRFVPLAAQRSVVLPEGAGKRGRWQRLAEESAKQSRRSGVMRIDDLTDARAYAQQVRSDGWYLSTAPTARPAHVAIRQFIEQSRPPQLNLLIGPEGGWTDAEIAAFDAAGLTGVHLGATILRIETAAVAAAAIVWAILAPQLPAARA